jgi:RimJ/RimL family protein N-acetyltransferase
MSEHSNKLGQPIGFPVPNWSARPKPPREVMEGRYVRLEPIDVSAHGRDLFESFNADKEDRIWTYLPYGPFDSFESFKAWLEIMCQGDDPLLYAIVDKASAKALGVVGYLRIEPALGVIEIGHVNYSPALQKTRGATETIYLMLRRVFDELGYRRCEWKCNTLNAPSRAAAARLGFTYEGLFRQAAIYKGLNRDTAWFSIIDTEWPHIKSGFEAWLAPDNFDAVGNQKQSLGALTRQA